MMETKILVIEDESAISESIKSFFETEGYDVKVAADGSEGINFFKMYDPDITVLDITLPKKDGWQVCREIRESSQKPIIMISTKGEVFDKVLGLELGADDYMVKPIDNKELSARTGSSSMMRIFVSIIFFTSPGESNAVFRNFYVKLSARNFCERGFNS